MLNFSLDWDKRTSNKQIHLTSDSGVTYLFHDQLT